MKKSVLFLCTGNSCRSQMAEGILRDLYGDEYEVYSAGVSPKEVNSKAVEVMKEIGIDISTHRSKSVDELLNKEFSMIITVCDNAKESCPTLPGTKEKQHWSISDPAEGIGSQDELLKAFREIRDEIKQKIKENFEKEEKNEKN